MHAAAARPHHQAPRFSAAGLLFALAGAGWAYWGTDIFLSAIMAGLAYCF